MQPSAVLVVEPSVNFTTILGLCHQMFGYSLSSAVDQSHLKHSDTERFLSCLAALRDPKAPAGLTPNLLQFASFVILLVADERDMIEIMEAAAGMPFIAAETQARGTLGGFLSGTLAQWRDAVKTGTNPHGEHNVRAFYCKVMQQFQENGLDGIWDSYTIKPLDDRTFYLEDKRRA